MPEGIPNLAWEEKTQEKFKLMINKMPLFHRRMAEEAVIKKANTIALARQAPAVQEQDVVEAFFSEVPKPFYSLMIRLFDDVKFDYRKYGFPKIEGTK